MAFQYKLLPVTPFQQNCALIWDDATNQAAIIDPGGDVPRILAALKTLGVKLTAIYLTHGHLDHAGGAAELSEATGIAITGPGIEDKFLLDTAEAQGKMYGFACRNCSPASWLREGDEITLGGVEFAVLHCPGHTPGHMVFVSTAQKFAILGDVLFHGAVGRTDLGGYGNHEQLIRSIRTKLLVLPDDVHFVCGHGPDSNIGAERRGNPFLG